LSVGTIRAEDVLKTCWGRVEDTPGPADAATAPAITARWIDSKDAAMAMVSHSDFRSHLHSSQQSSPALEGPDRAGAIVPTPPSRSTSLAPRRHLAARLDMAARTDRGRQRADNQDSFLVDRGLGLAMVCDGMGGHAGGARASALAVQAFRKAVHAGQPLIRSYIADHDSRAPVTTQGEILALLQEAADTASRAIHEDALRQAEYTGMGTTLVAVLVLDNHAFLVNVGDSRAYLLRDGVLEQLTRDHTVYDELFHDGDLAADVQRRSGLRNILTRALGIDEHCQPETRVIDLARGDRILLCSDGVSQYFDPPDGTVDELRLQLLETDGESVADGLLGIASVRGGSDDMTVVVLTIGALGDYETDELAALSARHEALSRSALFSALDEHERSRLLALATVRSFEAGQSVVSPDAIDDVYVLLRGAVTVLDPCAGVFELRGGEHIAGVSVPSAAPCAIRAVATRPGELLVIPWQGICRLLRTDPKLADKVLRQSERSGRRNRPETRPRR
jgi:serine/threonine protein phosphatase PrpC